MRKLFILPFFLLSILSFAQQKLEILYSSYAIINNIEDVVTIDGASPNKAEIQKAVLKNMQEPQYSNLVIYNNESYYKKQEKLNNDQKSGGISISINFGGSGIFYDLNNNYYWQNSELGGKEVTIKDQPESDWKLTRETKKIVGYTAKKATRTNENGVEITAWYTTEINLKTGPETYFGLPGLVLEVEVPFKKSKDQSDKRIITAMEVKILDDTNPLIKPKEKSVMNRKEYEEKSKLQFEKMKEMMSQGVETAN